MAVEVAGAVCDVDCSKFSGKTGTVGRQHPPATRQSLAGRAEKLLRAVGPRR